MQQGLQQALIDLLKVILQIMLDLLEQAYRAPLAALGASPKPTNLKHQQKIRVFLIFLVQLSI